MTNVNSAAWKIHFDGHGQGAFNGKDESGGQMDMQQYYFLVQKRKAEAAKK